MKLKEKNKIIAWVVALLFHLFLVVLLCVLFFSTQRPLGESGVPVMLGYIDVAQGTFEPEQQPVQTTSPPIPVETPSNSPEEELVTQEEEESLIIEQKKKEEDRRQKEEKKRQQEQERKRQEVKEKVQKEKLEQEDRRKQEIGSQVAGALAFGKGSVQTSRGESEMGSGTQGSTQGNSNAGKTSGIGGPGSYELGGRSLLGGDRLPEPSYPSNTQGIIVVDIVVSPSGEVQSTSIGRGSTVADISLRQAAQAAAKKARFNTVSFGNNQVGTITYQFNLR